MRSREDVDRAALIVAKWTPRDIGWNDVQAEAPRCCAPRGRGPTPRRDGLARVDGCWLRRRDLNPRPRRMPVPFATAVETRSSSACPVKRPSTVHAGGQDDGTNVPR